MRNFLAFVGAAVLTFVGIGYYLDWFNVKRELTTPGHSRLQVDINQEKIGSDVKQGADKLRDAIDKTPSDATTEKKPSGSDALLAPPPGAPGKTTSQDKNKDRAKDAFKDLIVDGWFTPPEKK